jgi:hypothetical protein
MGHKLPISTRLENHGSLLQYWGFLNLKKVMLFQQTKTPMQKIFLTPEILCLSAYEGKGKRMIQYLHLLSTSIL